MIAGANYNHLFTSFFPYLYVQRAIKVVLQIQKRILKYVYVTYSTKHIKFNDLISIAISHTPYIHVDLDHLLQQFSLKFYICCKRKKKIFISPRFAVHTSFVEM